MVGIMRGELAAKEWFRPGCQVRISKSVACFGPWAARSSENALQERKSAFERGDDEAEVHEHLENRRRTPVRHGGRTLSEPGIEIWTPSNDLEQSRRRES